MAAAKVTGLITSEQVDTIINDAVQQIATNELTGQPMPTGNDPECQTVVAQLKTAAENAKCPEPSRLTMAWRW